MTVWQMLKMYGEDRHQVKYCSCIDLATTCVQKWVLFQTGCLGHLCSRLCPMYKTTDCWKIL